MSPLTPDTELTLTHGAYALTVSPYGASLRGLTRGSKPVITGYHGKAGKVGGEGDVLVPWPGRITDGRYTFEGQSYQLPQNDKEASSAIHGFLRTQMWEIERQDESMVTFRITTSPENHAGYPFALTTRLTYRLSDDGLAVHLTVENTGASNAPVAAGHHHYFTVNSPAIDGDTLHVPFESTLEYKDLLPTGRVLPVADTEFDFRHPHVLGKTQFNTCYLGPQRDTDGKIRIRLAAPNGPALTVWLDESFGYVVLYSGDPLPEDYRRKALAIEPMSCASDAFNHPDWGLVTLTPGEVMHATWGVTVE
jgi:aldose 1-epimerase